MQSISYFKILKFNHYEQFFILGNQDNEWKKADVNLELAGTQFTISFMGTRGSNYRSDMAIDDVKVTVGRKCMSPWYLPVSHKLMRSLNSLFTCCIFLKIS